jgi:hypothetical protein
MENNVKFHGNTPSADQYVIAFSELNVAIAKLEV